MAQSGGDIGRPVFNKFKLFQKDQEYFPSGTGPSLALPDCPHGLAALFIYAGVIKLLDPRVFSATISTYGLAPEALLPLFAVGLPLIETIAGLALFLDRPWGLHLIMALLALFMFVLGYGILGDLNVDCGCFGAEELDKRAGLREAFYRDLILIGVVAPYLYLSRRVRESARVGNG